VIIWNNENIHRSMIIQGAKPTRPEDPPRLSPAPLNPSPLLFKHDFRAIQQSPETIIFWPKIFRKESILRL
jgi:hypothetical protein